MKITYTERLLRKAIINKQNEINKYNCEAIRRSHPNVDKMIEQLKLELSDYEYSLRRLQN